MKIGVITFWDSQDNYGQILQCYALQTFLRKMGHDACIIKYKPYEKLSIGKKIRKLSPLHVYAYIKLQKQRKTIPSYQDVLRNFDSFREEHLKYTDKIYHGFKELWEEDWSGYDAFICGSDQIWSPKPDEQLNAYFLQFAPFKSKRIAYAPSFGRKELSDEYQSQLHSLLRNFDAVSVREAKSIAFCEKANKHAEWVCDPTLLLTYDDYKNIAIESERKETAFCYFINWDTQFSKDDVEAYLKEKGLHTRYFCTYGQKQLFDYEKDQTIGQWISAIMSSKVSFTNSFHGTVFSIISHTPFVVFPLTGESSAMNDRLVSLLSYLGLEDRIYSEAKNVDTIMDTSVDWNAIDEKLAAFRKLSTDFIDKALTFEDISPPHNICFLTHGSVHHKYGGLDRVTELLTEYFQKKGCNVYYVSQVEREITHQDLQYFLPDHTIWNNSKNAKWLNTFLHEKNIDVVINQEGNVDLTIPITEGIRKITVLHFNPNYIDDRHFYNKVKHYPSPIRQLCRVLNHTPLNQIGLNYLRNKLSANYKRQINWADDFVMLSDNFRTTLDELLPQGYDVTKVKAINNPIVLDKNIDINNLTKDKVVLYVGRMDNNFKNVDQLLLMWKDIVKTNPEWRFVLCGDGPDLAYNKELVNQYHIDNVHFEGSCNPTEHYKTASIIMMSSSASEGWGMVLIEGMQYGCVPVVMDTYASVRDIVKDGYNGKVVQPSVNNFAEILINLMNDEKKQKAMSINALNDVKRFDMDMIGKQWDKLINMR